MGEHEGQIFVDASGRRKRALRYAALGTGAGLICFLGAITVGLFDSGPDGSALPWINEPAGSPQGAHASPSATRTDRPGTPTASATRSPSAAPTRSASATTTKSASTSDGSAGTTSTTSAPAPAETTASVGHGNGNGTPAPAATGKGHR